MNLSKAQLDALEESGYRLLSPALTAINLEVDELELSEEIRMPGTEAHKAYYRGYLRQTISLRDAIIRSAINGSNPAQVELLKFVKAVNNQLKYE